MKGLHFLIADDHSIMRLMIIQIVRDQWPDAVCEEADNGLSLVTTAMTMKFDIVVADVSMPHMDGLEALEILRAGTPSLPVVISSINSGERYAMRAFNRGAAGFIPKHLLQRLLVKAIRIALKGKRYISIRLAIRLRAAS
jgi:DNA-binding NarL/FixJ family response regulator